MPRMLCLEKYVSTVAQSVSQLDRASPCPDRAVACDGGPERGPARAVGDLPSGGRRGRVVVYQRRAEREERRVGGPPAGGSVLPTDGRGTSIPIHGRCES